MIPIRNCRWPTGPGNYICTAEPLCCVFLMFGNLIASGKDEFTQSPRWIYPDGRFQMGGYHPRSPNTHKSKEEGAVRDSVREAQSISTDGQIVFPKKEAGSWRKLRKGVSRVCACCRFGECVLKMLLFDFPGFPPDAPLVIPTNRAYLFRQSDHDLPFQCERAAWPDNYTSIFCRAGCI